MTLQDITYLRLKFSDIKDVNSFFNSDKLYGNSVKILYNNIKLVFGLVSSNILVSRSDVNNVFKFTIKDKNSIFGFIIYIPLQNRIDIYTSENVQVPLLQIKNKKIVYKTYSMFLEKLGVEKLFEKLYNSL